MQKTIACENILKDYRLTHPLQTERTLAMITTGIIAEYNPFHNGHAYHLNQVRARSQADYLMIVMSGDFVQRGAPAIADKYLRTQAALLCGADLVVELPCLFACSSAEAFAFGGVSLLDRMGVVDYLGFGCECGALEPLEKAAFILAQEPASFRNVLQKELRNGYSFPAARAMALSHCLGTNTEGADLFSSPNNILALEYLKALYRLDSSIRPLAVKREGSGYHEKELCSSELYSVFSSALALRNAILSQGDITLLKGQVPDPVFALLNGGFGKRLPVSARDFSSLLYYKLLSEAEKGYTEYLDVTKDLSDKIKKKLRSYGSFDSFCMSLKSRDLPLTRIYRCMTHILLNIRQADAQEIINENGVPYARVLGFRESSAPLLAKIKRCSRIPLIVTADDAKKFMKSPVTTAAAKNLLQTDLRAARLYTHILADRFDTVLPDEFAAPVLKL